MFGGSENDIVYQYPMLFNGNFIFVSSLRCLDQLVFEEKREEKKEFTNLLKKQTIKINKK